ncbi:MAG: GNAT family N-acetyltransferase [Clostridia bacterium]|nr:GNAT family N-acetyltransferase [Clostridia bacterium]
MITYKNLKSADYKRGAELYVSLGWTAYLGDLRRLERAWENSLYTLGAFDGDKLVGFVRCVGDGAHTVLIQDLIVREAYHRQGIGRALMDAVFEKYADVRQMFVVTGVDTPAVDFYRALGMHSFDEGQMIAFFK